MDVICILNDMNGNYIINNNELIYKSDSINTQLSCKFSKIINNDSKITTNYFFEIIYDLKKKSLNAPSITNINSIFLIGEHNDSYSSLITQLIEEFVYESVPFNFYIHEIKYNGVYDLILDKMFDINREKQNDFSNTKIFLNCKDAEIDTKKNDIVDLVKKRIKDKKNLSHVICTFENSYNKITIYNLSDIENIIDTEKTDNINYKNYFGLLDNSCMKVKLLDIKLRNNIVIEESNLMTYFIDSIKNDFKVIYNLTKISPKTWELVNLFYNYTQKNKKYEIIPYIKVENKPTNNTTNNRSINISKTREKNNTQTKYRSTKIPVPHSTPTSTSDSSPIQTNSNDKLNKSYLDNEKVFFELNKHISQSEKPEVLFDKLLIYNKFIFNQCVRNQLELQKANNNKEKAQVITDKIKCSMSAMLSVILEQLNNL